jgi:hypothetical protein
MLNAVEDGKVLGVAGVKPDPCTFLSTQTAHRFYLVGGYADVGAPRGKCGTKASYPMAKELGNDRDAQLTAVDCVL